MSILRPNAAPRSRLLPWVVAAAFAVAAFYFGLRTISLRSENDALRTQRALAEVAYRLAQSQLDERTLIAERMITSLGTKLRSAENLSRFAVAALTSPRGDLPEAKALVVWDPEQHSGVFTADKLPIATTDQDYRIWVLGSHEPISTDHGALRPDATGRVIATFKTDHPVEHVVGFGVRLEKRGAPSQPEEPFVLLGRP